MYSRTTWTPGITQLNSSNLNKIETQYDSIIHIGEIKIYAGATAPTNFLLCNGTSKSSTDYAALYSVIGYTFGGSSGWFHLPYLFGKFVAGYSGAGDYDTIGKQGGAPSVTLTSTEIPAHTHGINVYGEGLYAPPFTGIRYTYDIGTANTDYTDSEGAGGSHENRPPYVVLNYIIRYQ